MSKEDLGKAIQSLLEASGLQVEAAVKVYEDGATWSKMFTAGPPPAVVMAVMRLAGNTGEIL